MTAAIYVCRNCGSTFAAFEPHENCRSCSVWLPSPKSAKPREPDPRDAEIASLRADLARVTGERDEARAAARARGVWCPTCRALVHSDDEGTCVTCGDGGTLVVEEMADTLDRIAEIANATECYEVGEVVGHVQSLAEDRDEARAEVARLAKERDAQAANTVTIHKHMPTVPFVIGPPDDARIVAIVREWGGGGHELPSRLRNNGDYTTAALVEALRGVIGGSDA